jgi:hypothetical protein
MHKRYHHTQIGYLTLVALGAGLLFMIGLMLTNGFEWMALVVLLVLGVCLVLFATLTVEIDGEALILRFGPGLIQKRFRLTDIISCRVVKNPWYYGWGIHLTPSGWLYNVSGFWAIELQMKNGKKYRLGTDDPERLVQAIEDQL